MVLVPLQDHKIKMAKKKETSKKPKESEKAEVVDDQDNPRELDPERFTK